MLFAICCVLNCANIIISSTILTVNAVIAAETCEKLSSIKRAMERNKIYPSKAKALGQEGVVVVSFVIQGNGRLTNTRVTMECLYGRLNEAAYKIPIRIGTFEPIPRILNKKQWAIEVPITYEIEDD